VFDGFCLPELLHGLAGSAALGIALEACRWLLSYVCYRAFHSCATAAVSSFSSSACLLAQRPAVPTLCLPACLLSAGLAAT
jgi:hypothetical protein